MKKMELQKIPETTVELTKVNLGREKEGNTEGQGNTEDRE